MKNNDPINLCDDEGLIFSPTYAVDIAHLVKRACQEKWQGVYNISNPNQISLRNFCNLLGKTLNSSPRFVIMNTGPNKMVPNTNKLQSICQDFEWTLLETGISETVTERTQAPDE